MAAWWKKLVKALTGEEIGPSNEETDAPVSHNERSTESVSMTDVPSTEPVQHHDAPNEEFGQRLVNLTDDVDRQFQAVAARSDEILTRIDRLSTVLDDLAAIRDAGNGDTAQILENTQTAREHTQRLREIVASLPEIATAQAESIGNLDQRMNTVEQRTAATADAVADHTRSIDGLKDAVAEFNRVLTNHQKAQTDLGVGQQQITNSMNDLCGRITQVIQLFKAGTQRLNQFVEAPQARHKEMRDLVVSNHEQIKQMCDDLATKADAASSRATLAVVFAAVAAVAAIASIAFAFLK